MSIICPVCIEPLVISAESQVVCAPCGHVFHLDCLTNWLKEKSSCPTCRNKTKESHVKRLYLEFGSLSNGHSDEVAPYVCQVESLSFEVKMKLKEISSFKQKAIKDEEQKKGLIAEVAKLEGKIRKIKCNYLDSLNAQENLRSEIKILRENLKEVDQLKNDLENYKKLDKILYGSIETADSILKSSDLDPDNLIMLVSSFKTAFEDAKQSIMKKDKIIQRLTTENVSFKTKLENLNSQMSTMERVIETYKKSLASCNTVNISSSMESSFPDDQLLSDSSVDTFPSTSRTPNVSTPNFRTADSFKKFRIKRKQESSPLLNRKIKIVSSRLKRS